VLPEAIRLVELRGARAAVSAGHAAFSGAAAGDVGRRCAGAGVGGRGVRAFRGADDGDAWVCGGHGVAVSCLGSQARRRGGVITPQASAIGTVLDDIAGIAQG
jgi:hypothetical protein